MLLVEFKKYDTAAEVQNPGQNPNMEIDYYGVNIVKIFQICIEMTSHQEMEETQLKLIEAMPGYQGIRQEVKDYVWKEVVPRYAAFDPAHREGHALDVISGVIALYDSAPEEVRTGLDPEMLFVAAACHDLGRINGKEHHHTDSAKIIRADAALPEWFTPGQIEIIAEAAEDHRASLDHEPRSMYGKMVAEADRLIDKDTVIRRTLQYGMSRYPEMSAEDQIERALDHLYEKYGQDGYLKLWIPWSTNALRLLEFRVLLSDQEAAREEVVMVFHELKLRR